MESASEIIEENRNFIIQVDKNTLEGVTDNYILVEYIRNNHKIIAEPIGTPKTARRQNKILTKPFLLTKFEVMYLYSR